ncbi:MAG: DUF4350 domain-containing protein [Pyrinomonadaceae bacterium]
MRQRLAIIVTLIVVVVVLIALNAASYVRVEHVSDSESTPDRSTFNSGATGTQALFDFLRESGSQVVRWREPSSSLLSSNGPRPDTFVIIGPMRVPYSSREVREVLTWVESGGRLVIVHRNPDRRFLPRTKNWALSSQVFNYPWHDLDPNNFEQMTTGVKAISPSQPTALARNVESVMPSRFMGVITVGPNTASDRNAHAGSSESNENDEADDSEESNEEQPAVAIEEKPEEGPQAPVIHFKQERGALLVDYPHGKGRIVVLADPFLVANNGIGRADNLLLAVNVVTGNGGLIAFDEFHQGRAASYNALIQYFSGTPVIAICAQLALIGLAIVWSRGRRFARPLPLPHVDRRSKLEFVASMAELQQRAKAHDLALENIYGRVRRVLVRHAGLSNASPRAEIARRVAMRSAGINRVQLETLMRNCEDTINGAPTNAKESLRMVQRLREIESMLGLRTRSRDERQAERN